MKPGKFLTKTYLLLLALTLSVTTKAQLQANFSATPTSGCSPLVVRFTDQSTGSPAQWRWDLGNGTISFLQNPAATYFTPGKYTIQLVVRNASGADSIAKTEYIEVYAKPVINFAASSTTGCYPLAVDFTDQTTPGSGTIDSWLWDFGDGTTSTLQNPSHVYHADRSFNVTLQVRNSNGCVTTLTKTSMIQISSGVRAQFTNDNPQTCTAPVTIQFQNQSSGTGSINYQWDFGDGNTSTLLSPTHTYTSNGTFSVKLIVTNSNGCADTIIKTNAVSVGTVNAAFSLPATICQGSTVPFTNNSTPAPASVIWDFGNGNTSTELNPSYAYSTTGTMQVKMVADFGACKDSITKPITILASPVADFNTPDTASCKAPFTVNFSCNTVAAAYSWNFGDNSTASAQNPVHTYNSTGNFIVKLTVTAANGCKDSLVKNSYINIVRPSVRIDNVPDSNCVPYTKSFSLTTVSPEPITGYTWNFGDGNTSTEESPTHTYTTEGAFTLTAIIVTQSGCTDTARVTRGIVTNNKPTAAFTATPTTTCAKTPVVFTNQSTGGATKWLWDFGDSTTSTAQNPSHLYADTGLFTIKLKIWKGGCVDSIVRTDYIRIYPPIAKFNIGFSCRKPYERVFTDQSIGANEWYWNFGDGTNSNVQNPVHLYSAPGVYSVSLRVVNTTYGCEYTTTKQITVVDVTTDFSTPDTTVCRGTNVVFTSNVNVSDISLLYWTFGDGTSSQPSAPGSNNISHVYSNSGIYNVVLISTDKAGCRDTVIKRTYLYVNGPVAKFSASASGTCLNSSIVFADSTRTDGTHPIQQWQWDYGDNSSEVLTAPPFQHLYSTPGNFVVKLKVTDSNGCTDSTQSPAALFISKPVANFTALDTAVCPGKEVRFINQSTGPSLAYSWYFSDNSVATVQNPIHIFNNLGYYSTKLVVRDRFGCMDSITKTDYIHVTTPAAFFTLSDSIGNCPPLVTTITNLSTGGGNTRWDFGDSTYSTAPNPVHFYNNPGVYYITLTVTVSSGCVSTYQRRVTVKGPEGRFTYNPLSGCNPASVTFNASTNGGNTFVWDFNDGNTIPSTDSIQTHIYNHPGRYVPKLILIDQTGCQVPIRGADTIIVGGLNANFGFTNQLMCDSGAIAFTDSSTAVFDAINGYQWNFGNGQTSSLRNPVHQYTSSGIFYPYLVITSQRGCTDTLRSAEPVKVVASPKIDIVSSGNGCAPLRVTLNGQLVIPDSSNIVWHWNFGNGNTADIVNPSPFTYATPGSYTVSLTGSNSSGCTGSVSKIIQAYSLPLVNAGTDFVLCSGSSKTMQASGAATYSWSPSAGLNCTNCASPVTSTTRNTAYIVTGTSTEGCVAMDTVAVTVKEKFVMTRSAGAEMCKGGSKKLSASGANSYEWTPSASLDQANISSPVATPDTTTTYRVIGSDNENCFRDTGYITIKVYPIPTVEAGVDKTISVGQTLDLMPVISADVTDVIWTPTFGLDRSSWPGITVKPTENTEYNVEVKNRGGCTARDRVTVFVVCNGSNLFIPNTFSPNGDGTNDIFYPRGTGLFKVRNLRIFSRWGEIVFDKSNFDANNTAYGWDGTSKGKPLNPDVYVYTLEVVCDNGSVLTYRGNITLIK